jgi:hypothetical protein
VAALHFLAALLLALVTVAVSRGLGSVSKKRDSLVRSLAGGVSVAFVVLDLFVELAEGSAHELHRIVQAGPEPVHTVAVLLLLGMLGTFVTAAWVAHRNGARRRHRVALAPHLGYSALVGGALIQEAREGPLALALFWIAMAIHLGVVDHSFVTRYPVEHGARAAVAAAAALLAGAAAWTILEPPAGVFHVILALVAGATLLTAFRDELPSPKDARIGPIVAGAASFAALEQLRWWL